MKRKVDLLAAALADSQMGPGQLIQAETEAIPEDYDKCPQDAPAWAKAPQTRGRTRLLKENTSPSTGEKTVSLAGLEGYEEDQDKLGSILLGPQAPMVHMKIGGSPVDLMVDTVQSIQLCSGSSFQQAYNYYWGYRGPGPPLLLSG
jgi:hypothetical protein